MHEVAAVSALVDAILAGAARHEPYRADSVRVRLGSAFSEDALLQAFEMLAHGTPLEGACLEVEHIDHVVDCPCGLEQAIHADDLIGHIWVCPNCSHVEEVDDEDDLQLVGFALTPLPRLAHVSAGSR
jgi:Zn finger protein HypA/HybF involved in hydrogenase expression